MPAIRIVKTPKGEAPLWVRQAWIGCEIPLLGISTDARGLWTRARAKQGYAVRALDAFSALVDINPEANKWWMKNFPNFYREILVFQCSACVRV